MALEVSNSLTVGQTNKPLDARTRIAALADMPNIENPFLGMIIFCVADGKHYKVTALKAKQIGALTVPDAQINTYEVAKNELALGETELTAYRGDRGKAAYDHSQASHAPANAAPKQSDAEIKTQYENNANTNAFTDAEKSKLAGAEVTANKGAANGYAELDETGKVPSAQLPAYVDDVIEVTDFASLPVTGEAGKIYVTIDTNKTYRWSGSAYIPISSDLALGETSSSAYRGDRGKIAYDHSQTPHAPADAQKNSDITKGEIEGKLIGEISSHTHSGTAVLAEGTFVVADLEADDTYILNKHLPVMPCMLAYSSDQINWDTVTRPLVQFKNDRTIIHIGSLKSAGNYWKYAFGGANTSAYQVWLDAGNSGTEADFLLDIKGDKGDQGIQGIQGDDGDSAYDLWIAAGNTGTEADFLNWLNGVKVKINPQTGTSYTPQLTDAGKIIEMNNASANTVTLPLNSAVAFETNTVFAVDMMGAGQTAISCDATASINGVSGGVVYISGQYSGVSIRVKSADEWIIQGSI